MLEVGEKVSNFTLKDKDGKDVSLSDFKGKKVIIYFYPKDNTPGCTVEAKSYRDNNEDFENSNVVVIGISRDSQDSHLKFADKHNLPFVLLSDPDKKVIEQFGVWKEKNMFGKKSMGIQRSTFIIDEEGKIIKVYKKASAKTNAEDVKKFLGIGKQNI